MKKEIAQKIEKYFPNPQPVVGGIGYTRHENKVYSLTKDIEKIITRDQRPQHFLCRCTYRT